MADRPLLANARTDVSPAAVCLQTVSKEICVSETLMETMKVLSSEDFKEKDWLSPRLQSFLHRAGMVASREKTVQIRTLQILFPQFLAFPSAFTLAHYFSISGIEPK